MKIIIFILGLMGVLFSGYLSITKFLNDTCAFNEPCPYFLGSPACYYGFIMFVIIILLFILDKRKVIQEKNAKVSVLVVSFLGILFSGYFTLQEMPKLFSDGIRAYFFGLPTCALGLIFYLGIFIIALITFFNKNDKINS